MVFDVCQMFRLFYKETIDARRSLSFILFSSIATKRIVRNPMERYKTKNLARYFLVKEKKLLA